MASSNMISGATPGANLDNPPPLPDSTKKMASPKGNLLSLGQQGGSPQAQALSALALIEQGSKMLSALLPGLAPLTGDLVGRLRQAVPQSLSSMAQGAGAPPSAGTPTATPMAPPMPGPPPGAGPQQ
jgi:hypothetical protein